MAAEGGGGKLVVEVSNARNLMPKDGQGTASAYVMVDFDGQRRRTKTKHRDLHPQWDEKLEFVVNDSESLASENLEVSVYNDKKNARRNTFLGKVKISGSSFVKLGDELLIYYPLEKRSVFSQVKGEIGLKVYYVDDDPPKPVEAPPANPVAASVENEVPTVEKPPEEQKKMEEEKEIEEPKAEEKSRTEENPPKEEKTKQELQVAELSSPAKRPHHSRFTDLETKLTGSERAAGASYDLVDRVPYLFVRVLKAKHAVKDADDNANLVTSVFAQIVIGSHSVRTRTVSLSSPEWDQVFSFHKESLNSTFLEISVHEEKKDAEGSSLGAVSFDLSEIPKRSPPDSPLAPQWYTLESSSPETPLTTDVMLTIWAGTQADEAFPEAWQSDSGGLLVHTRSKAYLSPKLWYLRLTVIQTQDLRLSTIPDSKSRNPELVVKAQHGGQVFKTAKAPLCTSSTAANPSWFEDLIFVATEPFDPFLTVSVEDSAAGRPVGTAKIHLSTVHRRIDDRTEPPSRWLNLARDESRPYAGRLHVRACLEGGYHVLDEAAHATSDVRAASKQLSKPPLGLLEVGVRGAANLVPVKLSRGGAAGSTDAYAVLKYGQKWARTRTILDQFNPRWNEQYTWDVFDPCTVLTVAVFDNARVSAAAAAGKRAEEDSLVGKVRVRLSTLDANRVHLTSYPLTLLTPLGAKKMGELELAVRFTCTSWFGLIQSYTAPMLPRMHYVRPLGTAQQDVLRRTAARAVAARLARSEPPLGPEVVHHMLETDAYTWSMRRSKANWFRLVGCLSHAAAAARWADGVRTWTHPTTTVLVHVMLVAAVTWPGMIVPAALAFVSAAVAWRYRKQPAGGAGGMDAWLSCAERVGIDELDEEFDGVPSGRAAELVRGRYDRLRLVAGRAQGLLGDMAAQGERVEALLTWRDRRATGMFVAACAAAAVLFYVVPFKAVMMGWGFYYFRHPRFRGDMPAAGFNFFRRLPSMADRML